MSAPPHTPDTNRTLELYSSIAASGIYASEMNLEVNRPTHIRVTVDGSRSADQKNGRPGPRAARAQRASQYEAVRTNRDFRAAHDVSPLLDTVMVLKSENVIILENQSLSHGHHQ